MTRDDVTRKFRRSVQLAFHEQVAAAVEQTVLSLEEVDDVRPRLGLLRTELAGAVA